MTIVYEPEVCYCSRKPRSKPRRTIWQCDDCGTYWVSDGNDHWFIPFPFGPTARRIKRIEKHAAADHADDTEE